ncbi:MAG: YggU family protein [Candidatus Bathyarchaeum sp.]|nr:MAG: YggU family protein [Candidatus Bathyarchaeum sp.]
MRLLETAQGVVLDVYVKPNAKVFQLKIEEDELVVLCREAPVKGKVNKELLKQFSRLFARKVELVSGFTSRQKKFLVCGTTVDDVKQILASASNT